MFYEIASSKTSLIFQDDNGAIYVTCKWSESAGSYCIMALACLVDKTQPIFQEIKTSLSALALLEQASREEFVDNISLPLAINSCMDN